MAGWDREILAIELQALIELDFDVELTGFDMGEIDLILDEAAEANSARGSPRRAYPLTSGQPPSFNGRKASAARMVVRAALDKTASTKS